MAFRSGPSGQRCPMACACAAVALWLFCAPAAAQDASISDDITALRRSVDVLTEKLDAQAERRKDFWDKMQAVAGLASGVLVAIIGGFATYLYNDRQRRSDEAQRSRELSALEGGTGAQNDILSIGPSAITYRAMRGIGFICSPSSTDQLRIHRTGFSGFRDPQAGRDSVLVFAGDSSPLPAWIALPIARVSTTIACPGNFPGVTLTVGPSAFLVGRPAGTPVRIYEHMELRMYASEGKFWLGTRSLGTGEVIQPLFGPLSDEDGFRLAYLDRIAKPTARPSAIRSIEISVHGMGDGVDALFSTEVALRNAEQRSE